MAKTTVKCPYCGCSVPASQTDSVPIRKEEIRDYKVVTLRIQRRVCPCGATGITPVFVCETTWEK